MSELLARQATLLLAILDRAHPTTAAAGADGHHEFCILQPPAGYWGSQLPDK